MVGTWVWNRQLVASTDKISRFSMVKFSSEYNRCLNRCVAFPAWYNNYLSSLDISFFGLHSKLSTSGWWLVKRTVAWWDFLFLPLLFSDFRDVFQQKSLLRKGGISWDKSSILSTNPWYWWKLEGVNGLTVGMLKTLVSCAKDFRTSLASFYICFSRVYHWFLCWIVKASIRVGSSWNSDGIDNLTNSSGNLGVLKDLYFERKGRHTVFFICRVVLDHAKKHLIFAESFLF